MWSNLLSGTIGSIIGVGGAVVVAYLTVEKTRRHEAGLAEQSRQDQAAYAEKPRQIETSGMLAYHLVALYDELRAIEVREVEPAQDDLDRVGPLADALRRSIVVDAPLLPNDVEVHLKATRKEISALVTIRDIPLTREEITRIRGTVRAAGDVLREFRRPGPGSVGPVTTHTEGPTFG
jgi:hypothetical protein